MKDRKQDVIQNLGGSTSVPTEATGSGRSDVRLTVHEFRLSVGDTQQAFATRLGVAISTVVRWESTREPDAYALTALLGASIQFPEFFRLFAHALKDELKLSDAMIIAMRDTRPDP